MLEVAGLNVAIGPIPIIRTASLAVGEGEMCGLIGRNGAGKTTFLRALMGATAATGAATFNDVDLIALLTADPERAQWFAADHLGKLAAQDDDSLADLRATALCYLESGCSLVKTAAALHVHRNTVLYRLGSIERLLGRELGKEPLATHAALALVQRHGRALLDRDFTPRPHAGEGLADATYL